MTILEIDEAIENCVDPETGEFDEAKFNDLAQAREEKIEQLICFYKNVSALAKAIKDEETKLKERRIVEENKAERIKQYIAYALAGEKFKTAKVAVSYKHTTATECADNFVQWAQDNDRDDLLSFAKPTANKTAIKAAIESGETGIPAQIVENVNTIIK